MSEKNGIDAAVTLPKWRVTYSFWGDGVIVISAASAKDAEATVIAMDEEDLDADSGGITILRIEEL